MERRRAGSRRLGPSGRAGAVICKERVQVKTACVVWEGLRAGIEV